MASVSSLDQDMKNLRMGRYTPQAANEVRAWIEETLGEPLPAGDLLNALKDGTALCRLVNMAIPTPVRFKKSAMPFIQMENIAHFLKACELPPLNLPSHDRFLTVDLFESKDPAQVLQCLTAFSRVASQVNPDKFPSSIGLKRGGSVLGPTPAGPPTPSFRGSYGSSTFNPMSGPPAKPLSPSRTGGSNTSRSSSSKPVSPSGGVSSWSKKTDQGSTSPAWNIHQYGYMGGASQGNQGIAFGARRQITTAGPVVSNMAEKERKRKAEEERLKVAAQEAEQHRRVEREAEEDRQRVEEERLWEEESRKQREAKERRLEVQKREWEEQEQQWKLQEEARKNAEREAQEQAEKEARRKRAGSDARLRGQYLSQYQAEQKPRSRRNSQTNDHNDRIAELERQLAEAKERERQYQLERENRKDRARSKSRTRPEPPPRAPSPQESNVSWVQADDRAYLRDAWEANQQTPPRPLPEPTSPRPLPDPAAYAKQTVQVQPRPDRPLPTSPKPQPTPGHRPSKSQSLLEREMERERERQREWEESQRALQTAAKDPTAGTGEGQSWDVNQYGYMGGDSQNRGGISFGGKRQILGPRPFGPR